MSPPSKGITSKWLECRTRTYNCFRTLGRCKKTFLCKEIEKYIVEKKPRSATKEEAAVATKTMAKCQDPWRQRCQWGSSILQRSHPLAWPSSFLGDSYWNYFTFKRFGLVFPIPKVNRKLRLSSSSLGQERESHGSEEPALLPWSCSPGGEQRWVPLVAQSPFVCFKLNLESKSCGF